MGSIVQPGEFLFENIYPQQEKVLCIFCLLLLFVMIVQRKHKTDFTCMYVHAVVI